MYSLLFTAKQAGTTTLVADALHADLGTAEPAASPSTPHAEAAPSATAAVPFRSGGQQQQTRSVSQLTGTLRLLRDRSVSVQAAQGRTRTIFIPAVPAILGASDLCAFLGSLMPSIEHMRFLRTDGAPGRYAALLRFATQEAADSCFRGYNGRPFSSLLDPSVVCRALFVASARIEWVGEGPPPGLLDKDALRLDDSSEGSVQWGPGSIAAAAAAATKADAALARGSGSSSSSSSPGDGSGGGSTGAGSSAMVELPSCPVCLERLDSSASGLLTTLCQHSFHSDCLSRWAGSDACPVCRYCLWHDDLEAPEVAPAAALTVPALAGGAGGAADPAAAAAAAADTDPAQAASLGGGAQDPTKQQPHPAPATKPPCLPHHQVSTQHVTCESCGLHTDLWMCLVCGCVGCGRYSKQHQIEHWKATGHCYAIELSSQRVWDYASDSYVHRLLQNRADGKLVELPDAAPSAGAGSHHGGGASTTGSEVTHASDDDCLKGSSAARAAATALKRSTKHLPDAISPSTFLMDSSSSSSSANSALPPSQRMDGIAFEYTLLLTSQLESQRMYFEGMLSSLVTLTGSSAPAAERKLQAEAVLYRHHGGSASGGSGSGSASAAAMDALLTERESRALRNDLAAAKAACAAAEARCAALESERRSALRRAGTLGERVALLEKELAESRALEEAHALDRAAWDKRAGEAERRRAEAARGEAEEMAELREQVRDLMLTLDMQARMARVGEEAAGGTVVSIAVKPGPGGGAGSSSSASGSGGGRQQQQRIGQWGGAALGAAGARARSEGGRVGRQCWFWRARGGHRGTGVLDISTRKICLRRFS